LAMIRMARGNVSNKLLLGPLADAYIINDLRTGNDPNATFKGFILTAVF